MQLYLDSYGAFLAVRNGMFAVRTRAGGERTFAVRSVQAVLLTKSTGMSTDAALLAAANDIPVLLIDANTHYPLAQVTSGRPGSIAAIRKNQAVFARSAQGFSWVAEQLAEKIAGQRALLRQLEENPAAPPGFGADIRLTDRVLAALEKEFRKPFTAAGFDPDAAAGQFRGREGTVSRLYFAQLAKLLANSPLPSLSSLSSLGHLSSLGDTEPNDAMTPNDAITPNDAMPPNDAMRFTGRQKRPAYDPFNVLLNYLYGMLYTSVHLSLLKAGLDPYMGVLHADRYGAAPTLVFDAIEPFRPWADEVALGLMLGGRVTPASFEQRDDPTEGLWLSGAGKDVVIESMLAFLESPDTAAGPKIKRRVMMDRRAQALATQLKEL